MTTGTAGHADHIQLGTIGQGGVRNEPQAAMSVDGIEGFPNHMGLGTGQAGEHLQRAGEIELRHCREGEQANVVHGCLLT